MTSSDDDSDMEVNLFEIYFARELDLYMRNGGDINMVNAANNASIVGVRISDQHYDFALYCLRFYPIDISIRGAYNRTIFFSPYFEKDPSYEEIMCIIRIVDKMIKLDKTGRVIRMVDEIGQTPTAYMKRLYKKFKYILMTGYKEGRLERYTAKMDFYRLIYHKYIDHEKRTSTLFELMLKATEETPVNKKRRFQ